MSGPHVKLDPDPLWPGDRSQAYVEGYAAGWEDAPRIVVRRGGLRPAAAAAIAVATAVLGFLVGAGVVHAAPRPAPEHVAPGPLGVPSVSAAADPGNGNSVGLSSEGPLVEPDEPGGTPTPTGIEPAAVEAGKIAYALASFGDRYLAIPAGPGHRVRICVVGRCIDRTSTDAGPSLQRQREGRIADVSFADFAWLCRCDPPDVGLVTGSITELGTGATPPPTDVDLP